LVDEKGGHEDIHKFASNADIVVCCLSLNGETVRSKTILVSYTCVVSDDYSPALYIDMCKNEHAEIIKS
jgi:hypothetical protein